MCNKLKGIKSTDFSASGKSSDFTYILSSWIQPHRSLSGEAELFLLTFYLEVYMANWCSVEAEIVCIDGGIHNNLSA